MNQIIENLLKWYKGSKAPPEMVQIYPTNRCNLSCIFCVQKLGIYNLKEEVTKKRFLGVVEELCRMEVKRFLISGGGEPLCTPSKTFAIMRKIKSWEAEGRMITSGFLWNKLLIKKTIELGWDCVVFSLHGSNKKTHDYLTQAKGTFDRVIENIKIFQQLKKEMNSTFPVLEFTFVINKHNLKEVEGMVKLAHKLGVDGLNLEPLCINNDEAEKIKLDRNERNFLLNEIIPGAEKLAKKFGIRNNFSAIKKIKVVEKAGALRKEILKHVDANLNDFLSAPCYEPWLWPKIEANGEVWPCSTVQLKATNIKFMSFKKIWYGNEFDRFRERILKKDIPKECGNCVLTHLPANREIREKLVKLVTGCSSLSEAID